MSPVQNKQVIFTQIPSGSLIPGQSLEIKTSPLDLDTVRLNGGVLVKTLILSADPYLRGRMRDPKKRSYISAYEIGKPIQNFGVGRVLRSEFESVKPGQLLYSAYFDFAEYTIISAEQAAKSRVVPSEYENIPLTAWVGAAGMPGKTAHYGLYTIGKPKKGETIFISAASGAVGQIVGQLAKREGLKVIGSAGSDDKVAFIKELGFDVTFNYKTQSTDEILSEHGPIDIYWDNVGGETLDIALTHTNDRARIVACGSIVTYNGKPYPLKNTPLVVGRELTWQGFIILHHPEYDPIFYADVPPAIARGEIRIKEDIRHGLETAEQTLIDQLEGNNFGKAVIIVADS